MEKEKRSGTAQGVLYNYVLKKIIKDRRLNKAELQITQYTHILPKGIIFP